MAQAQGVAQPQGGWGAQNAPAPSKPAWLAPLVIIAVVIGLIALGRKKEEAVENPIVDIAIITVGVFAFAALFRFMGHKLGAPGLAAFFGGSATAPTPTQ